MKFRRFIGCHRIAAFSLIEVVIALGIISFCLIAILGLFSAGLKKARESDDEIRAANLLSSLVCRMRSAPHLDLTSYGFPLGVLTNASGGVLFNRSVTNPVYVRGDGTLAPTAREAMTSGGYAMAADATYNTTNRITRLNITLWWPAAASYTNMQGKCSIATFVNTETEQ